MATAKQPETVADRLRRLNVCDEALAWAADYSDTLAGRLRAWRECGRADWMMWVIGRLNESPPWSEGRKPLLACALDCAETVRHLWPEAQRERMAEAVARLRRWIAGEATAAEGEAARAAAWEAARAAARAAAWEAARAAASAAAWEAASASAWEAARAAASAAAWEAARASAWEAARAAASAAAWEAARAAAWEAASAAARAAALKDMADIVRRHFPKPPTVKRR